MGPVPLRGIRSSLRSDIYTMTILTHYIFCPARPPGRLIKGQKALFLVLLVLAVYTADPDLLSLPLVFQYKLNWCSKFWSTPYKNISNPLNSSADGLWVRKPASFPSPKNAGAKHFMFGWQFGVSKRVRNRGCPELWRIFSSNKTGPENRKERII